MHAKYSVNIRHRKLKNPPFLFGRIHFYSKSFTDPPQGTTIMIYPPNKKNPKIIYNDKTSLLHVVLFVCSI